MYGADRPPPRRGQGGFTLFEMLVAIAIIAVFIGMAGINVGSDRRGEELQREALRFSSLIGMAGEEAVLRSQEWGLEIDEKGYRFTALADRGDRPGWALLEEGPYRAREFDQGTVADILLEGRDLALAEVKQSDDKDRGKNKEGARDAPPVLILSSGEITPFSVTFTAGQTTRRFRVTADLLGRVEFEELARREQ